MRPTPTHSTIVLAALFGIIVIAAIFGTSILRDFQRDTYQILFTKPISKFAYLGGRWAGSFVTTVFAFSGMMLGTWLGTFAPWADHTRIGPNHLWAYLQPFFSILVVQIFFIGSAFFAVAALTRKIFIVYLQGVALFMMYVIGITVFSATRSLERFWSGIFDPIGLILFDDVTRYWTVVEKNTLFVTWSPHSRQASSSTTVCCGCGVGVLSLGAVWVAVSHVGGGADRPFAGPPRRQSASSRNELKRSPSARWWLPRLARVHQAFTAGTTFRAISLADASAACATFCATYRSGRMVALLIAFGINNGYFAGRVAETECLARHLSHAAGGRGQRDPVPVHRRGPLCRRTALARARHPLRRHPRRSAHARVHRLALPAHRHRRRRTDPAHVRHARAASSCRPSPATTITSCCSISKNSTS